MVYRLIEEENNQKPNPSSKQYLEGLAHAGATQLTSSASAALGLPGDVLGFINDFVARPLTELITGKESLPYEETGIGKIIGTSSQIEKGFHKAIPYTKPRNDYEKFANNLASTTTSLLIPGGQAKVGRFIALNRPTRALLKSVGAEVVKTGAENLSGNEDIGNLAKAGALFTLALLDNKGAGKYVGSIYKNAENALEKAGNPSVNASSLKKELINLRNKLSKGTLAESERAVVTDIEQILGHFKGDEIPVENLWGSVRSLNEQKQKLIRSAASKEGRLRARKFYDSVIGDLNKELTKYGKQNPNFGKPFQDAQEGFGTLAKSNLISNWVEKNLHFSPINKWLPHLFGAGSIGGTTLGLVSPSAIAIPTAGYQSVKFLYRISKSPTLRKYYFSTLRSAIREDVATFNKNLKKLDKNLEKEDKDKKPYRLID